MYFIYLLQVYGEDGTVRSEDKVLKITVKPGWKSGTRITFAKEGDQTPGKIPADIAFIIRDKPHPLFSRDGATSCRCATPYAAQWCKSPRWAPRRGWRGPRWGWTAPGRSSSRARRSGCRATGCPSPRIRPARGISSFSLRFCFRTG